jgi:phage terminase large subunit-like protein
MEGAWEIWNFTPWLVNDVYAYIKSTGMYVVSKSPVMRDAQEGEEGATLWEADPLIPLSGKYWKLSWPEQFGFERLTDVYRRIGQVSFAKMYMLDLEATRGINLKTEWLHQYPAAQIFPSWPVIMGIDYASTMDKLKDKERDFFSLAILRAIPGGGLVLVDGYRGHVSKGEALNVAASYSGTYPTLQKIGVENIGKGEEFYNDLMLTVDMNGKPLPLMPVKHGRKSKGDRFENWLAPRFQASRIWVSDVKTPYIQSFENQWSLWPNAPHDDDLDAVYMAAFAGEGFMPAMAERTFRSEMKQDNPFLAFAGG